MTEPRPTDQQPAYGYRVSVGDNPLYYCPVVKADGSPRDPEELFAHLGEMVAIYLKISDGDAVVTIAPVR